MRILVVEDEEKLADLIASRLRRENYSVDISLDGEDGFERAIDNIYDLIILDVMLPKMDGFSILTELHNNGIKSDVLMLTAKSSIEDKLVAFNKGVDDYVTKPFHMEELVARVNVRLRKTSDVLENNILKFKDLSLDLKKKILTCCSTGDSVEVICKEFLVLECLMRNCNQVVSKEFLYDNVWGVDNDSISNNLEAYISFIRKKLKVIGSKVSIKALRGLGYKLEG